MPDLLIRNVPPELHARLKAAAAAHRRSLTQEAIQIIENNLLPKPSPARPFPKPIQLRSPTTMEETQRFIDEDIETRGY
jgi:plasmid stability protein